MSIELIEANWKKPAGVSTCSSTRKGGFSAGPYSSLNLADHVNDDRLLVNQNRRALYEAAKLPAQPQWLEQTHSADVVLLEANPSRKADAAITRSAGVVAAIMTADCLPVLLADTSGTEVAAIHAGWRGLANGIIQNTLVNMVTQPERIQAWIGPSITQAHFEVGQEVRQVFLDNIESCDLLFKANRPGHYLCDLAGLAEKVLRLAGVQIVYRDPHCSYRDEELFFSYRRQSVTGRMVSLIWVNNCR
ncbi:MAG: YfiH family protein [Gammaproteobacteria bacterium]